ncbi:RND family efflux transporter, MFP subunit [Syntrophus gentianae]|uniref:RND family efflux transporter, MFP subunit n=1 Tax=Syntrophus gentianae TaxID=43775 RepID=A0A1H8A516_9BACT|nr:efflux RND transporter periplasmic adaptor subunit [Syntrophus gentianae]SEM65835.1 RND family efflux transporter, MFP subunit [Syntrophus gentianae]
MVQEDLTRLKIDKSDRATRKGRRLSPLYWIAAVLFLLILVLLYFTGRLSPAVSVEVAGVSRIYPSQTFSLLNASGYVVAQRKAAVAAKITGRLVALSVEEGSRVKAGEIIARLEDEDARALRDQAAANLNTTRAQAASTRAELHDATQNYQRKKELLRRDVISRAEFDSAEARYLSAKAAVAAADATQKAGEAALRAAQVSLDYDLIRAPFDAVVLTKNADIGDIVTPLGAAANAKAAVVTIADLNSLQVEADVAESNLALVKIGQPCEIQLDALPDTRFRGQVHMIVPTADRTKATIMVKVRFLDPDPRILPEMSAKVAFLSRPPRQDEQRLRTAVNASALVKRDGRLVAYRIQEDRVSEIPVKQGESFGDLVEVLDGLKPGDRVVLKPSERLRDGSRIQIKEK